MKISEEDSDEFELRNGRRFYANLGILGMSDDLALTNGYDGHVAEDYDHPADPADEYEKQRFTSSERREIAEYMIALWTRWAAKPEAKTKEGT
jgi:hypothetical protein